MRIIFTGDIKFFRYVYISMLISIALLQIEVGGLCAEEKKRSMYSLDEIVNLALDFNSETRTVDNLIDIENVTFLVKKYYYQIQAQTEQLDTAREVQGHFQKAIGKSEKIFEEGEGNIAQSDITKLKLGMSDILNEIITLKHSIQIAKLQLETLIGKELMLNIENTLPGILPVPFSYYNLTAYLKAKNLPQSLSILDGNISIASSEKPSMPSKKMIEGDRLTLYKAFISVEEAVAKVNLGKKNRKITRALLVAEVANYDFGIGESQDLFEALIIYTRVLKGYLSSVYTLNVAVAELDKLAHAIYK